ncbi:MAG: hypothetical protein SVC26_06070 [Pseudomonadota bacterium]|nr:hypothetical protein [Pseudomonadota bacterium]
MRAVESTLADMAQHVFPALCMELDASSLSVMSCDPHCDEKQRAQNKALMRALLAQLKTQYPEAGRGYWHTRLWSLIFWQPVYFAVIAVETIKQKPRLSALRLHVKPTSIWGYHLESHDKQMSFDSDAVTHINEGKRQLTEQMALQLKEVLAALFEQFLEVSSFSKKKSKALVSMNIVLVLRALAEKALITQRYDALQSRAEQWQFALGLSEFSGFVPSSHGLPVIKTRACCMHYRIDPNDRCSYCPKSRRNNLPLN